MSTKDSEFSLFTSLSYSSARPDAARFSLLHRHLARLHTAHARMATALPTSWCATVPLPSDAVLCAEIERAVDQARLQGLTGDLRIRLSVLSTGNPEAVAFPLSPMPDYPVRVVLDDRPTEYGDDPFLRCKTSKRRVYDSARARRSATLVPSPDPTSPPFDVLLFNTNFQLTESSISNVAFRLGSSSPEDATGERTPFITPSTECGLLEGVMRAELLERGEIVEGVVTLDEVKAAARRGTLEIICFNGVRGVFRAYLAPDELD